MKSRIRSAAGLVAAAALGAGIALGGTAMGGHGDWGDGNWRDGRGGDRDGGRHSVTAESIYLDEIKDYGVCRGVDPECYNDYGNGWVEGEQKRILIWSRTAGPRHAHLGTPLAAGLNPPLNADNVAQAAMIAWAAERGIAADYTEDLSQFRLNNYQAVVFLSSNRDTLDDTAQTTLMQYVRGGGGFVGIHNAFGAEGGFNWSSQHLDRGGVQQWRRRIGSRRRVTFLKGRVGSGVRIERYDLRCAHPVGQSPRGRCSGSSGS
ncbi:ThuA domain-containing protein [Agromyces sp. LHK192]|uniref:ThuA domain-containing protein n=1 Tax=Agromyces sp. LHK192 TaxID=2498704 RepID=UPI00196AA3E2|nr:ThuA domain-containing protein [Agromyces sp. LHK192]